MSLLAVFLLAGLHQVVRGQFPPNIPEECKSPPPGVIWYIRPPNYSDPEGQRDAAISAFLETDPFYQDRPQECCKIPPLFSDTDFEACSFKRMEADGNVRGPPDCEKQKCLLKRNHILDADGEISITKMRKYMTKWAEKHPEFKRANEIAKDTCVGRHLPGPPHLCETNKLILCISSVMFSECPVWQTTKPCTVLMNHMKHCKPYFQ